MPHNLLKQKKKTTINLGKHMINHWPDSLSPQWSRQAVVTIFVRGPDRSTWFNGVATDLFCTGVIGHPKISFLS